MSWCCLSRLKDSVSLCIESFPFGSHSGWYSALPPECMMLCCFWFVVCSTLILFLLWFVCVQFMYLLQTVSINNDITYSYGPDYVTTTTTETLHKSLLSAILHSVSQRSNMLPYSHLFLCLSRFHNKSVYACSVSHSSLPALSLSCMLM